MLHPKHTPLILRKIQAEEKWLLPFPWLRMVSMERPVRSSPLLELHPIMMIPGSYSSVSTPSSACPAIPLPSTRNTFPSDVSLMDILRSFPKLTAAGPSGLRIQHLIDAAEVPLQTPFLQTLRAVVNLLISGCAPMDVAIFLAGGNLERSYVV